MNETKVSKIGPLAVQRSEKRFLNLVKKDPGRARSFILDYRIESHLKNSCTLEFYLLTAAQRRRQPMHSQCKQLSRIFFHNVVHCHVYIGQEKKDFILVLKDRS